MIPVTQTKMVVKDSKEKIVVNGNCWAAAIASILELPISEVPNFEIWFSTQWRYLWDELTKVFLISHGYTIEYDNRFRVFHISKEEWETKIDEWDRQYIDFGDYDTLKKELNGQYYFISGPSPRGVNHVTIWKNGVMVHDPHPSRDGIIELKTFEFIRHLTEEEKIIANEYDNNRMIALPSIIKKT